MAEPAPETPAPAAAETPEGGGFKLDELGLAGSIAAAVGGGLGLLGFVAFFGAAILWVRMKEAGLPANETLAVIPKSVLISTGASFVVPALLVALGFVVVVYLVDGIVRLVIGRWVRWRRKMFRASARKAEKVEEEVAELQRKTAAGADGPLAGDIVEARERREAAREARDEQRRKLEADKRRAEGLAKIARVAVPLLFAVVLLLGGTIRMTSRYDLPPGHSRLLIAIAVLLVCSCVALRLSKKHFAWFAAASFLAVCTLAGGLTYFRTVKDAKVEPAALLRTDGMPVYGTFVSQTSDRVYLGTSQPGEIVRLEAIPRAEVIALAIGGLLPHARAETRARALALHLCTRARLRLPPPGAGGKGRPKAAVEAALGCTERDLRWLRS